MSPHAARDGDGGSDVLSLVRRAIAARNDVVGYSVHEATPESVIVEIETRGESGTTRRTLYHVTREPTIVPKSSGGGTDRLHWVYLGAIRPN